MRGAHINITPQAKFKWNGPGIKCAAESSASRYGRLLSTPMREGLETCLDSPGKLIRSRCTRKLKRDLVLDLPSRGLMWLTIAYFIIGIDLS